MLLGRISPGCLVAAQARVLASGLFSKRLQASCSRRCRSRPLPHLPQQVMVNAGPRDNMGGSPRAPLLADTEAPPAHAARSEAPVDWLATGLCFLFPAIGGLLFGYDIGATSGALVSIKDATLSGSTWYDLTSLQSGLIVSMSLFGALAGSLAALGLGDRLGRKSELLLAASLYVLSATLTGTADSLEQLLVGRSLYGLGIGFAMHAAPAYIAETSPSNVRGLLISLKEGFIVGGILLGYLASYLFIDEVGGWRIMYSLSGPVALLLCAGMITLPESPRWLLLTGKGTDEACRALVRAQGKRSAQAELVQAEMEEICRNVAASLNTPKASVFTLLSQPRYSRPLKVGVSLMLLQQITGQPSVLYYAANIFQSAGFAGANAATGVSVVLGAFKLVMTLVAVLFVDVWGRRPLLLYGVSGLTGALVVLTLATTASVDSGLAAATAAAGPGLATWASVGALLLYVGCYQVSFGPISWLLVGEVFPLAVRGQAVAIATFVNFFSNFLVSLVLPTLQNGIGLKYTYALFGAIGVLAVASIFYTVPETKGKSLEEIEALWTLENADPRSFSRD